MDKRLIKGYVVAIENFIELSKESIQGAEQRLTLLKEEIKTEAKNMKNIVIKEKNIAESNESDYKFWAIALASILEYLNLQDDNKYINGLDEKPLPPKVKVTIQNILKDIPQHIKDEDHFVILEKYFE